MSLGAGHFNCPAFNVHVSSQSFVQTWSLFFGSSDLLGAHHDQVIRGALLQALKMQRHQRIIGVLLG